MTKRKVLVIDDEVDIAKLVVEILTDEGFTAEAVHTGEEGLKKVREWLPDLILLDWQLPDTEGVDVCRIIKNDAEIAYIPVIMLTSLGSESHKIRGLEAGADDYVTKPFSAGELLARVKVMFRRMQREEKVIESKIAQLQKFLPKEMLEKIISAAPRAREGEKRIVTVMIADLSGFTSLAEQLSAEKVTGLINDCFNSLINVISNYGGTIDKFMGDAIMALFGAPVAHEDDPVRAMHSALVIKEKLKEFNEQNKERIPKPFEIRIGINTGPVVAGSVGSDEKMEYTVMGDAVNIAARLQTSGTPGQILVSEDSYFHASDFFEFGKPQEISVKGKKERVTIYELIESKKAKKLFNEIIPGKITQFVGHKREMDFLKNYVERLSSGVIKQGVVLSIFGDKGAGKSRAVYELIGQILSKNLFCIQAWCFPYGSPFFCYDYTEKKSIGLEELRQTLEQRLQQKLGILIIDDLDFAKEQEIKKLCEVFNVAKNSSLIIWCIHRQEFQHPCASESYYRQIEYPPLTLDDTGVILDNMLDDVMAFDRKSLIINMAEGIPLYVEEIIKHLIQTGHIKLDLSSGKLITEGEVSEIEIPPAVQCIAMAQIDGLGAKRREILQVASVIGREFKYKMLRMLIKNEDELKTELNYLSKIGIISEKSALTERTFMFKHGVMYEVIKGTVLETFREEIKKKIDRYLEAETSI